MKPTLYSEICLHFVGSHMLDQKDEPSAGWGSFLCWGKAMYLNKNSQHQPHSCHGLCSPSQLDQNSLHCEVSFPLRQGGKFCRIDLWYNYSVMILCLGICFHRTFPELGSTQGILTRETN
jgi:hypothetical protein